jgi:tryptophan-rich sensory protein
MSSVRSLRVGSLLVATANCVVFAILGGVLVGESLGTWYDTLDKPWFLLPLWVFYIIVGPVTIYSSPPCSTASSSTLTTAEEELPL